MRLKLYKILTASAILVALTGCLDAKESVASGGGQPDYAGARIGSWNITHLGWNNGRSYEAVARVLASKDFVAIQELMSQEGIERVHDQLEADTGDDWAYVYSEKLGTSSYREKYGFIWRESVISLEDGGVVYIDPESVFQRPPYAARFRINATGQTFVASTVHITFGDSISDRVPEIQALGTEYWDWLVKVFPGDDIVLAGDMNLRPTHEAFDALRQRAEVIPIGQATTLSPIDQRWANEYDSIWLSNGHEFAVESYGLFDFPDRLSETDPDRYWSHEAARSLVSDHGSIYFTIDGAATLHEMATGPLAVASWDYGEGSGTDDVSPACVDLNASMADQLQTLPGIGPAYAQRIIEQRPWAKAGDLAMISGIGPVTVSNIISSGLLC